MILVFDNLFQNDGSLKRVLEANNLQARIALSLDETLKYLLEDDYTLLILSTSSFQPEAEKIVDLITSLNNAKDLPILLVAPSDQAEISFEKYQQLCVDGLFGTFNEALFIFKVNMLINKQLYINGLKDANSSLKTELEKRKMAEAAKEEFISIAGHELSTPITSISAYLQLALRSAENRNIEQTVQLLTKGLTQINKLNRLAKDLLDSSRLQAGKMEYNFAVFNCQDFLKQTVEHVKHSYPDRRINVGTNVNVWLEGDQERLEQVLTNYLTNALKYSPINTEVLVYTEVVEHKWLKICVRDFGQGIPKDKQPYIFHKYYRVDGDKHKHQGLGMGLFICAQIITHHQGQFGLESEPGNGSVFYFSLPIKAMKEKTNTYTTNTPRKSSSPLSSLK